MEEILVPIGLFGSIVLVVWLVSHFNSVKRQTAHKTMRLALERGQELSPELMDRLSQISDPIKRDMRRAVLLASITIGIAALAFILPVDDSDAVRGILGGAVFPGVLSLAYFGLWIFGHDRKAA